MDNITNILTKEFLLKEHFENKKTYQEIANEVGCSLGIVWGRKNFHDIKERQIGKNFIGYRFGKLTVVKCLGKHNGRTRWLCKCDCGKYTERPTEKLCNRSKYGRDTSCGCNVFTSRKQAGNWKGHGGIHGRAWRRIKKGAQARKHLFDITIEYGWDLFLKQNEKCALSGLDIYFPETSKSHDRGEWTASLDRIDNTKGYIEGNVQWLHKHVNLMKQCYNQKYFIDMCKKISSKGRKNEK